MHKCIKNLQFFRLLPKRYIYSSTKFLLDISYHSSTKKIRCHHESTKMLETPLRNQRLPIECRKEAKTICGKQAPHRDMQTDSSTSKSSSRTIKNQKE